MSSREDIKLYYTYIRANILKASGKEGINISLRHLADVADIDFSNFIHFMNGDRGIQLSTLIKIANALKVTPGSLLDAPITDTKS